MLSLFPRRKGKKRGPSPKMVNINEDWSNAVGRALKKKRPKKGWPKPVKKKEDTEK